MKTEPNATAQPDGLSRLPPAQCSVAASDDESSISIEYHLQWRKHPDRWYFGGMVHTYKGALLALKQERKDAARTGEGVEWRMIEQKKQRRILPV